MSRVGRIRVAKGHAIKAPCRPNGPMAPNPLCFLHTARFEDLPAAVRSQAKLCLLDLLGVGIGGSTTRLSKIICDHAVAEFGGGVPILFDARTASASGAALAGGMTIDALDAHDGWNPAKGHAGCGLLPGLLALAHVAGEDDGREILTCLALGYEYACRLAAALHGSVPDYHTSGAWVAVAVAGLGARLLKLGPDQTRHALGIAEYHGPRSQMMRCIDQPTMLKDGSGWGAMAGVSAALMAAKGFTGAPAITVETGPKVWNDLGTRWLILEQYFKPYPVCRWAQGPVEAVLALKCAHGLAARDIERIEITSFHEATRLAVNAPQTTEEAQYSTSFPCAIALVRDGITPADVNDAALSDPEILRLSTLR